jgi:hypothetical protein
MKDVKLAEVIELLRSKSEPLWIAAKKAVIIAAGFEMAIGLIFSIVAGGCVYHVVKKDADEGLLFVALVLGFFGFVLLSCGFYETLTIDYQTYKTLLP